MPKSYLSFQTGPLFRSASQTVRIAKALTPAQRVFQHEETFANLKQEGVRLVRMKHEHIPLVVPVFKDFWSHEITAKSVNFKFRDEHAYPLLFNCVREPYSFLLLKDDEIKGHTLQYIVHTKAEHDKSRLPKTTVNVPADDKYHFIDRFETFYEQKALELVGVDRMIHMFASYVHSSLQGNAIMQQMIKHITKENVKLLDQGIIGAMGITTRKASEVSGSKTEFDIIYAPPAEYYAEWNNGVPVTFAENGKVASLHFMDFKKMLSKHK